MSEADKLRQEAKGLLLKLFKIPDGFSSGMIERVVDCIVGAAVLEVASLVQHSAQQNAHLTPESLASSQAVSNASALEQSDGDSSPAQAQVA